jgi:uncharacterized membrane protein YbhN (UPF0104 family)
MTAKKISLNIALYTSTVLIFYFLLKYVGVTAIVDELKQTDPIYLFYSSLLSLVFAILSGLKLKTLVKMMGYKIGWTRCQKITFATYPLNVILPSKSGDLAKSWPLRGIMPASQGVGIVILDRLIDLIILFLMSFVGSALINDIKLVILSLSALLIGITLMLILYKVKSFNSNNRFFKHIKDIGYATRCLLYNWKYSIAIFSISIFIWLGSAFQIFLLYAAVGKHIPLTFSIAVVPIAIFIGILPITVAGMGTRDLSLVYLFSAYSTDSASISVGLLFSFLRYWILALVGIPFLPSLKGDTDIKRSPAKNQKHI